MTQRLRATPAHASFVDVHARVADHDLEVRLLRLEQLAQEFHENKCPWPGSVQGAMADVKHTVVDLQQTLHDIERAQSEHEAKYLHQWRSASCDAFLRQLDAGSRLLNSRFQTLLQLVAWARLRLTVPSAVSVLTRTGSTASGDCSSASTSASTSISAELLAANLLLS